MRQAMQEPAATVGISSSPLVNAGSNWSVLRDRRIARVDMGKARRLLIEDRRLG